MSQEFANALRFLHLTQAEAAKLLGVDARTARRWAEGTQLPGPVQAALFAWVRLHKNQLPWRPGSLGIASHDKEHCAARSAKALMIDAAIEKVEKRGGPMNAWIVDFHQRRAISATMEVTFTPLVTGGFCPNVFTRTDRLPDLSRDRPLIEDAAYCIARAQKKRPEFGPVRLTYHTGIKQENGRWRVFPSEEYATNEDAIARACRLFNDRREHRLRIYEKDADGKALWNESELVAEWKARKRGNPSEHRFIIA